jgi:hypothetical protein
MKREHSKGTWKHDFFLMIPCSRALIFKMNILFMEQSGDIFNTMKQILKFIICNHGWVIQSFTQKHEFLNEWKVLNFKFWLNSLPH